MSSLYFKTDKEESIKQAKIVGFEIDGESPLPLQWVQVQEPGRPGGLFEREVIAFKKI